jgi:hypothetical protein
MAAQKLCSRARFLLANGHGGGFCHARYTQFYSQYADYFVKSPSKQAESGKLSKISDTILCII